MACAWLAFSLVFWCGRETDGNGALESCKRPSGMQCMHVRWDRAIPPPEGMPKEKAPEGALEGRKAVSQEFGAAVPPPAGGVSWDAVQPPPSTLYSATWFCNCKSRVCTTSCSDVNSERCASSRSR